MSNEIKRKIRDLAERKVNKYFHSASKTHIFYQGAIGSFGARGVGFFADDAFNNYLNEVEGLISELDVEELKYVLHQLEIQKPGVKAVKEIQIQVPKSIKEGLAHRAKAEDMRLAQLVRSLLVQYLPTETNEKLIRDWFWQTQKNIDQSLIKSTTDEGNVSISVRLDRDYLNDVRRIADIVHERDSKVARMMIMHAYNERLSGQAALH